jgi:conjugal transfer/entry exclusion protein
MTLTTYANAITVAQSQAADFNAEDTQFENLEACNATSISVLQAIQCGNEINLAAAQQTQMLRQLEITRLIVEAVHAGSELNERAQLGANSQTYFLTGGQH